MFLPKPYFKTGFALATAFVILIFAWMRANAQTPSPDQLKEGARLYAENCAVCHGPKGEGRVGATLAKNWPSIRPDITVHNIIANGIAQSPMPAWSQAKGGPLTEEQIGALTGFLLSWETGGFPEILIVPSATAHPPITPVAEVQGDPNHGAALYGENCVMCHGPKGEGRIGATLAKAWPSVRPDISIKTTIMDGVEGSPMPAWSQAKGGPLSENDINDLVAYVLSLPHTVSPDQAETPTAQVAGAPSWAQGLAGLALFVVVLVVVIGGILLFQKRP
jgi:mono/diheme cytochrome c family protein